MDNVAAKASGTGGYLSVFADGHDAGDHVVHLHRPHHRRGHRAGRPKGGSVSAGLHSPWRVFGLTMAIPFVFLSLSPKALQAMPRSGVWMKKLKVTLGIIELGLVLKFLSNVDLAIGTYYIAASCSLRCGRSAS